MLTDAERAALRDVMADGRVADSHAKHGVPVEPRLLDQVLRAECGRFVEHLTPAVEAIVAARLADHRRDWAAWLDGWVGAVTPTRPTPEAVVEWLRADHLPFGVAAAQPTTTEAS